MRIDAYTHFIPKKFFDALVDSGYPNIGKRMREMPCIHDIDLRKKVVDTFPDYAQIISHGMPPLEALAKGEQVDAIRQGRSTTALPTSAPRTAIISPAGWRRARSARRMPASPRASARSRTARSAYRFTPTSPASRSTCPNSSRSSQ